MCDNDYIVFLYDFHKKSHNSLIFVTKIDLDQPYKYNNSENDFNNI